MKTRGVLPGLRSSQDTLGPPDSGLPLVPGGRDKRFANVDLLISNDASAASQIDSGADPISEILSS
jgi:hypothetical protein